MDEWSTTATKFRVMNLLCNFVIVKNTEFICVQVTLEVICSLA